MYRTINEIEGADDLEAYREALSTEERKALAAAVGIVPLYLYQVATGHRRASPELTRRLAKATGLAPDAIRPDYFDRMAELTGMDAETLRSAERGA